MKKLLIIILSVAALVASCDMYTDSNGALAGYWKLCSVDTISGGGHLDMSRRSVFWAIQTDLLTLRDNDTARILYVCRFDHTGQTLRVSQPRLYEKARGDSLLTHAGPIRHFGVNSLDEAFTIHSLRHDSLILSSEILTLHFRRF